MDASDYIIETLTFVRKYINSSCSALEPWEIILYSVITTLLMFYVKTCIDNLRGNFIF